MGGSDVPRLPVDELISLTLRGADGKYTEIERTQIRKLTSEVERLAGPGVPKYLEDARLLGDWAIQYVLDGKGRGSPVGGPFRYTWLGRLFFPTTDLFQNILT